MMTGRPKKLQHDAFSRHSGLTLWEVVIMLLILGVLAGLLLPALAKVGNRRGPPCLNNLRQLGLGWIMYADDNNGRLVPNGRGPSAGKVAENPSWVGGWLDFSPSLDNIETRHLIDPSYRFGGKLGPYVKNPVVFRCVEEKTTIRMFGRDYPRVRSIAMNQWVGGSALPGQEDFQVFHQMSDFTRLTPAQAWLMIEEHPDSINDGSFAVDMKEDRWLGLPASSHYVRSSGARYAGLNFADGHSELLRLRDRRTNPAASARERLSWLIASPENPDLKWLRDRTTVPLQPPSPPAGSTNSARRRAR